MAIQHDDGITGVFRSAFHNRVVAASWRSCERSSEMQVNPKYSPLLRLRNQLVTVHNATDFGLARTAMTASNALDKCGKRRIFL
ncbi:MAG: hypothetical protein IPK48_06415 [Gammaproteobacteria bacterium]|nr:hypothetical protein [Gammaproteobacteria bacterium]